MPKISTFGPTFGGPKMGSWGGPSITPERARSSRGPTHIDREQLEYSAATLFTYGVILFTAMGVGASVAYMTVQQLRK